MNQRLLEMLGNARNVMNKVESGDFTTGNIDTTSLNAIDGTKLTDSMAVTNHDSYNQGNNRGYNQGNQPRYVSENGEGTPGVAAKNLPKAIQDLMKNHPIEQPRPTASGRGFSLADVQSLVVNKPQSSNPINEVRQINKEVNEILNSKNNTGDMVLVSKAELKNAINETLLNFMTTFSNNLKEVTIKETINMLIREGKINVTKKK